MQPQRNFDTGIVAPTDNLALKKAGPGQRRRLPLRFVAALAVTVVLLASFAALVALPLKGAVVTSGESLSRGQRLVHDDDGGRRRG